MLTPLEWGRGTERGERIPGGLCTVSTEPDAGLENCETFA